MVSIAIKQLRAVVTAAAILGLACAWMILAGNAAHAATASPAAQVRSAAPAAGGAAIALGGAPLGWLAIRRWRRARLPI